VQGQLRGEPLSVLVQTECGHCGTALQLEINSELRWRVGEEGADPLVFVPDVDFDKLADPSIIDAF
jgi:hypothetical protein